MARPLCVRLCTGPASATLARRILRDGPPRNDEHTVCHVAHSINCATRGDLRLMVPYAATAYRKVLAGISARCSMSRNGDCFDNAPMESFFKTLKAEAVYQTEYAARDEARRDVFTFVEVFYNRQHLHSGIGYLTP